jgi:RNA-directed DNA polymerase
MTIPTPILSIPPDPKNSVAAILAQVGLELHPDKTRTVCLIRGQQGFDFLGFHHHKVESWRWRGHYYLNRWASDRAMNSIRATIRETRADTLSLAQLAAAG